MNDYLDMDADNRGRIEKWRQANEC
ncbi:DUF6889 family protein [Escherichia coli]